MRKSWFEYVRSVKEKENRKRVRKNNPITHKQAMKLASETWPKYKLKLQKKLAKEKISETISE